MMTPNEGPVVIQRVELREVALPLVRPFRTSFGEEREKRAILVRVLTDHDEGWGECVASSEPRYSEEWLDGAWSVLERHLCPGLLRNPRVERPEDAGATLSWVRGHRMAKASLDAAALDAYLRNRGERLADFLGAVRDRVPCGVSVGIAPSVEALLEEVQGYLAQGYRRVKLKIEPGWDVAMIRDMRAALSDTPMSVDANAAYSPSDMAVFEALDELELVMIEQPLHHEDLVNHAKLQGRLRTPICLDESIRSAADAAAAIELGACRVINIKPGRVGGILEGKRIHDVAKDRGVPVWIGGMLETGVGRAPNVALAAMEGVTMPGDTSASERYFKQDLTEPFVVEPDGTMPVPKGPGVGVEPLPERLQECTVRVETVSANA